MINSGLKVSVIIPTYNGRHRIDNLLECLVRQTIKSFETIIVIDGSADGTKGYLNKKAIEIDLKVYSQENKGRAVVRNTGSSLATGDLLIFFDDDMRPEPNCVEQHLLHHQQHSNSLMSGAQIDDPLKATSPFQKYKCYLSKKWAEPLLQFEGRPLPLEQMHLTAANFSIPRLLFQELGGFDEQLRDNEDLDLALRAFHKGYSVYYRHSAFSWHDDFPSCRRFIERQAEYKTYHKYVAEYKKRGLFRYFKIFRNK